MKTKNTDLSLKDLLIVIVITVPSYTIIWGFDDFFWPDRPIFLYATVPRLLASALMILGLFIMVWCHRRLSRKVAQKGK